MHLDKKKKCINGSLPYRKYRRPFILSRIWPFQKHVKCTVIDSWNLKERYPPLMACCQNPKFV